MLRYAGVEHVWLYDTAITPEDFPLIPDPDFLKDGCPVKPKYKCRAIRALQAAKAEGFVTVEKVKKDMRKPPFQKPFIDKINKEHPADKWRMFLDFDEYASGSE